MVKTRFKSGSSPQLGSWVSGCPAGSGSGVITSRPAAAMRPARRASTSASWSTMAPRLVFTSTAVGFIFAKAAASIRPRVVSVSEQVMTTTSDWRSRSSSGTSSAPTCSIPALTVSFQSNSTQQHRQIKSLVHLFITTTLSS